MPSKRAYYRTSEVARSVGVHPNTIRWYESAGLLGPIDRDTNGYRRFSAANLVEAKLVYRATRVTWMSGVVRSTALEILALVREGALVEAATRIDQLVDHLNREIALAREALAVIAEWLSGFGELRSATTTLIPIRKAAHITATTADQIRNWERNGLLILPRDRHNGYRVFGDLDLSRLKVIRLCRLAGYSITAIRRLMAAVDQAPGGTALDLERVANCPTEEEKWYETFPTDVWISTLTRHRDTIDEMIPLIAKLKTL